MIEFKECTRAGYPARTEENVLSSDGTIAIAMDFSSPGERLTKSLCEKHGKPYLSLFYDTLLLPGARLRAMMWMAEHQVRHLNGAGNCLDRLKGDDQFDVSAKLYNFLLLLKNDEGPIVENLPQLASVRSGGQTGIDEAFLHAAVALDIPAFCLAPKGWVARYGFCDIADEKRFKARFI